MADILIRGMEMPKDGRKHNVLLQFLEDGKCRAIVEYSKSYDDRSVKAFEAVPLPEGHGRLGDLDKINASLEAMIEIEHNQRAAPHSWSHAYMEMQSILDEAPIIVPAEEGADDGT